MLSKVRVGVLPRVVIGGAAGIRTPDFLLAKEALSRTELQPHGLAFSRQISAESYKKKHLSNWIVEGLPGVPCSAWSVIRWAFSGRSPWRIGELFLVEALRPDHGIRLDPSLRTPHPPTDLVTSALGGRSLTP